MSAETLREAAQAIRDSVDSLPSQADWDTEGAGHGARRIYSADSDSAVATLAVDHALYFASWHPAVALAVARWLEAESYEVESDIGDGITFGGPCMEAEAVATAYLGTSP